MEIDGEGDVQGGNGGFSEQAFHKHLLTPYWFPAT
jgi:hypothetical protein